MRYTLACLLFGLGACSHAPPPRAEVVEAYHTVRAGYAETARAGDYQFRAQPGGVEAYRVRARSSDGWSDQIRDEWIQNDVQSSLMRDPVLASEHVVAVTKQGEVTLTGGVESDEAAVRAIRDALHVAGVVAVRSRFDAPPTP